MTDWLAFVHIWRLIGIAHWARNTYAPHETVEKMRRQIHALTHACPVVTQGRVK